MTDIVIKRNKEGIIQRGHPWIFSGALQTDQEFPENGSTVRIVNSKGEFLAKGHYQNSSIAVRILSYLDTEIDIKFYKTRLEASRQLREQLVLDGNTNAYRWVNGEGDRIPGLVIDNYNGHIVMECHSDGVYLQRETIAEAIHQLLPDVKTIYCKRPDMKGSESAVKQEDYLKGDSAQTEIIENGNKFLVNWEGGQKTGFFIDQRDNRQLLSRLAGRQEVLNLYSYSGGFSIYAGASNAVKVTSVDVSQKAIDWLQENIERNEQDKNLHDVHVGDVMDYLKEASEHDVVVVDPPAFAKNINKRHNAVQAYKRLNARAIEKVRPGGYLMTFSCSQVVDPKLFYDTVKAAFFKTRRSGQVIQKLSQGRDHPVLMKHEEGNYLKGLLIRLE